MFSSIHFQDTLSMLTCFKHDKDLGFGQGPFVFLESKNMHHTNLKFVANMESDYISKIDFHSAEPEDRSTLRRMANRQVRRRIRQDLKSHLDNFLD